MNEELEYKAYEEKYPMESLKKLPQARIEKLELDKKYNKIDEYTYEKGVFELTFVGSDKDREKESLDIDLKYGKITQEDYNKDYYDSIHKPYRKIVDLYNPENPEDDPFGISIGIDYNKTFIEELKKRKYVGTTPDEIVRSWFNEAYLSDEDRDMTEEKTEVRHEESDV